jgi:hypothetical protein
LTLENTTPTKKQGNKNMLPDDDVINLYIFIDIYVAETVTKRWVKIIWAVLTR